MRFNPDDYIDVQERIVVFWDEYPDGAIRTELASPASNFEEVVFRAEIFKHRDHLSPDAVGYAAEKPGNGANQTSWHENCETSAIGRALANMGYATSRKDRPSKQEMRKVMSSSDIAPARTVNDISGGGSIAPGVGMTDQQRKAIWAISTKERGMTDTDVEQLSMQMFGVELKALDKAQASELIATLKQEGDTEATHPKVQAAIDSREANWIAAMEGAATMGEMNRIAMEIQNAKVQSDHLRHEFAKHRDRINAQTMAGVS